MHARINRTLAATAFGLAGLVTWQVLRTDAPPPPLPVTPARTPPAAAAQPAAAVLVAAALARPLFTPDRRPPRSVLPPRPERASLPRLAGVTTGSGAATAFLVRSTGTTVAVVPGEHFGELVLREVDAESATLEGPAGVQVLHLAFTAGVSPAAAMPGERSVAERDTAPADGHDAGPPPAGMTASELRAVLASAAAMELAGPGPQGCCVSDLGWWRLKSGAAHGTTSW